MIDFFIIIITQAFNNKNEMKSKNRKNFLFDPYGNAMKQQWLNDWRDSRWNGVKMKKKWELDLLKWKWNDE